MPFSSLSRSSAIESDRLDVLSRFRDQFLITDKDICYLDGNSLGRLPKKTIAVVDKYLHDEWAGLLVSGWSKWIDEAQVVGDLIGRAALGLSAGQMLCVDTTSVNFYQLCLAAIRARPGRKTVITDTANFPTDRYILQGICENLGLNLVFIDDDYGQEYVSVPMLAQVLSNDVALVSLSVVQYRSGALHDIAGLTKLALDAGALFVWDASHAVGVVPLDFERDYVDLAVGCTYKYGNSGPGSPAWLFVSNRVQDQMRVPIQGWFAQADQFGMGHEFSRASGMRGVQIASPSIIGMRCVQTSFEMIEEAGIGAIAKKAAIGTELMVDLYENWLVDLGFSLVTPIEPELRGGHITLRHPQAKQISEAIRVFAKVVGDFRQPDCLRLAISPLATSFVEVWDGFDRIREVVATNRHLEIGESTSRVT